MAELQQTLINGNRYAFQNVTVRAADRDLPRGCITALEYTPEKQPGEAEGNLNVLVGRTEGVGKCTGSISLMLSEAAQFYSDLTDDGAAGGILEVDFDIVVQYSVNGVDTLTDTLRGVRLTNLGATQQQGPDVIVRTHSLSVMRAKIAGIDAYTQGGDED